MQKISANIDCAKKCKKHAEKKRKRRLREQVRDTKNMQKTSVNIHFMKKFEKVQKQSKHIEETNVNADCAKKCKNLHAASAL